jgi:6-phosphogluconolactonase (cycloisomerase 2 family)
VSVFRVDSKTGVLAQVVGSPYATGLRPIAVAFSRTGLIAVANHLSDDVSVFSVNRRSGALSALPASPFAAGTLPLSAAFSPDGRLLAVANYIGDFLHGSVSVYAVSRKNVFSAIAGSPFTAGFGPYSVSFSPDGRLLATANISSGDVSVYSTADSR